MQQKLEEEEFKELLKKYETAYQKPIKISEISPNDDNWYSIAYLKYPYILYKLEEKIGPQKMNLFLSSIYENKISLTEDLIKLLRKYADENIVKELDNEIR